MMNHHTYSEIVAKEVEVQNEFCNGRYTEQYIPYLIDLNERIAMLELVEKKNIETAIQRLYIVAQLGAGENRFIYTLGGKKVLPDFRRIFFAGILTHHPTLMEQMANHGLIGRFDMDSADIEKLEDTRLSNQLRFYFEYFLVRSLEAAYPEYYTNDMQRQAKKALDDVVARIEETELKNDAMTYQMYADGIIKQDATITQESIYRYYEKRRRAGLLYDSSFCLHSSGLAKLAICSGIDLRLPLPGVPAEIILDKCIEQYEMYFWIEAFTDEGVHGYNALFEEED